MAFLLACSCINLCKKVNLPAAANNNIVQNNDLLRGHASGFQQISSGKFEEGFLTIEKCCPGMGYSWCP